MTNRNPERRFDGRSDRITVHGRVLPFESGVLSEDFPDPLHRLKEASGLTWTAFAQSLGVDRKQVHRWRKGVEPCGGAMHCLFRFALRMPSGLEILMGDGFRMTFWEKES